MQSKRRLILVRVVATALLLGGPATAESLIGVGFDDLLAQRLTLPNSLTRLEDNNLPGAVTRITARQIRESGARELDEVLEMFVPGLQIMRKAGGRPMGVRGIISDRNNKILLTVNGQVMNTRSLFGAVSERFVHALRDIQHIDVLRGPGGPVFGPGAIAAVVSITTFDPIGSAPPSLTIRSGFGEQFTAIEATHTVKWNEAGGVSVYFGADRAIGSDSDLKFSDAFTPANGQHVVPGDPVPDWAGRDGASPNDALRHKTHLHIVQGDYEAWARIVRGGDQGLGTREQANSQPNRAGRDHWIEYVHYSGQLRARPKLTDKLRLDARLSYDLNEVRIARGTRTAGAPEEEWHARAILDWEPSKDHRLALGVAFTHDKIAGEGTLTKGTNRPHEQWSQNAYSVLAEYQWRVGPLIAVLGGRADKHDFTDWMLAPRLSIQAQLTPRDAIKAMVSQSVRRSDDADLRSEEVAGNTPGTVEEARSVELRYERRHGAVFAAASTWLAQTDIVSWSQRDLTTTRTGRLKTLGIEGEVQLRYDMLRVTASHNWSDELDLELVEPILRRQNLSASPYGYPNDLANWSNHSSRLTAAWDVAPKWMLSTSAGVDWGYPGAIQLARYNDEQFDRNPALPLTDGVETAWGPRAYWNLGAQRQVKDLIFRVDGHDLLGLADPDLNRRMEFMRTSQWRNLAPSVTFTIEGRFE